MIKYILKRLLFMIPIVLGVTILIFTIMYFTPGDPAIIILGANASEEQLNAKREELGLNEGYFTRLGEYMSDVFLRFDFGNGKPDYFPRKPAELDGSCPWTGFGFRVRTPKDLNAKKAYIIFTLRKADGTAWVDRVKIREIGPVAKEGKKGGK